MDEIEHFSHDHPLILRDKYMEDGTEVHCYGCLQPILGQFYSCNGCRFFLDKSCAQLPQKILHPSHPEHHLTLLPNPPSKYTRCVCDVCREASYRFTYHCPGCKFDVHVKCASMSLGVQQSIKHSCHEHPLMPLEKPISFLCDACATKHEDTSYLCTTCGLWVSQKCASLPTTIQLIHHHHHPLTLFRSVPCKNYNLRNCRCKVCGQKVYRNCWVYYCSECSYFVHVNCATFAMKDSRDSENESGFLDLERNSVVSEDSKDCKVNSKAEDVVRCRLISLPALDDSIDLTAQFMKDTVSSLQSTRRVLNKKGTGKIEIWHASHDHPLVFSDKQMDHELCSSTDQLPSVNKCSGCAKSISTPFYQCAQCNFFLHELCAGLPNKLRHPCHLEHPLFLTTQQPTGIKSYRCIKLYRCRCCRLFCDTFMYGCSKCAFYLDCKCACLPRTIKHEAHKHELSLRRPVSQRCSICVDYIDMAFVCEACHLNICAWCALLPGTVSHRYDQHPFTLTYSPIKGFEDQDFCEICLKEFTSSEWFYHCGQCNQSLHANCIRKYIAKQKPSCGVAKGLSSCALVGTSFLSKITPSIDSHCWPPSLYLSQKLQELMTEFSPLRKQTPGSTRGRFASQNIGSFLYNFRVSLPHTVRCFRLRGLREDFWLS